MINYATDAQKLYQDSGQDSYLSRLCSLWGNEALESVWGDDCVDYIPEEESSFIRD